MFSAMFSQCVKLRLYVRRNIHPTLSNRRIAPITAVLLIPVFLINVVKLSIMLRFLCHPNVCRHITSKISKSGPLIFPNSSKIQFGTCV